MSEESTTVVRLDAAHDDAVADRAIAFLLAERVIEPNARRDDLMQPSAWAPGPAADSVLAQPVMLTFWRDLAGNGVDVVHERVFHGAMENFQASGCPSCATTLPEDTYFSLLEEWATGEEPTVTCPGCGAAALLGDWPSDWPSAVGGPAVVFHNWPPLSSTFLGRLRAVMGGRTVVVRAHF